jgi:hypothetical protein
MTDMDSAEVSLLQNPGPPLLVILILVMLIFVMLSGFLSF